MIETSSSREKSTSIRRCVLPGFIVKLMLERNEHNLVIDT